MSTPKRPYQNPYGDGRKGNGRQFARRMRQLAKPFVGGVLPAEAVFVASEIASLEIDVAWLRTEQERLRKRRQLRQAKQLRREIRACDKNVRVFMEQLSRLAKLHEPEPTLSEVLARLGRS